MRLFAEAGALDALAVVLAGHLDPDAHLGQPGSHAVADAVAESLFAGGAFNIGQISATGRQVSIVGGNDGRQFVVVTRVENQRDRVPDPIVRLLRAQDPTSL